MQVVRIEALPEGPLEAAAAFHAIIPPRHGEGDHPQDGGGAPSIDHDIAPVPLHHLRWSPSPTGEDLLLVLPPADHTHRDWRLAAVRGLARDLAPRRVNAIATNSEAAVASALRYLEQAPGVTGHYLPLDGAGAGPVLGSVP